MLNYNTELFTYHLREDYDFTAPIGKVVDENQETKITNLFVSDASVFPSPLGMPPILTIVALSKKLAKYLLANN